MPRFGRKENIHWCRSDPGKENPMALKQKAIDPDGNVRDWSLANGKAIRSMMGNTYAQMIQYEKKKRGWVLYETCGECPPVAALEHDPDLSGLCEKCGAREVLIRTRMDVKRATSAEYEQMFETRLDKLTKAIESKMVGDVRPTVSAEDLQKVMASADTIPQATAQHVEPEKTPRAKPRPRK